MKKIAIDISQIVYGTGSSVYTKNLVEHLLKIDTTNKYLLFAGSLRRGKEISKITKQFNGTFETKITRLSPNLADILWNRFHIMPVEYLIGKIDVFHASDWTQPPTKARKITTIHDLAPLVLPQWTDPLIVEVHKRRLNWVRKEADAIIVPSKATKDELVRHGYPEDKITVIYEASEEITKSSQKEISSVLNHYNIQKGYFLAIGANPRKNINRLVQAFESLNLTDTDLVVIGRKSVDVPSSKRVKFLGYVTDLERIALLSGAKALVYPSLYEGFGLPILDAFSVGTPVVTSNVSSMPEVAGDAALLVDPESVPSIAEGMHEVIKNREKFIKRGFDRMKHFSWKKAALETLEIYMQ